MGDIVNLRQFRKRKKRRDDSEKAEENRIIFGTSSKIKKASKVENEARKKKLDGKLRDPES